MIIHLILSVALVCIIILQSGKARGLSGAFGGGSETFMSKNKQKSFDSRLARATKWFAGVFLIITIVLNLI